MTYAGAEAGGPTHARRIASARGVGNARPLAPARPPVGWQSTAEQEPQSTTVWEWLNTVVMLKQPWHFTSMKKELGLCTRRLSLCLRASSAAGGCRRSTSWGSTCWKKKRRGSEPVSTKSLGFGGRARLTEGCSFRRKGD